MDVLTMKMEHLLRNNAETDKKAQQPKPKTLKKLTIKLTPQQVRKIALKTLRAGGMQVPDPVETPLSTGNPPSRNLRQTFNDNARKFAEQESTASMDGASRHVNIKDMDQLLRETAPMAMPPSRSSAAGNRAPSLHP